MDRQTEQINYVPIHVMGLIIGRQRSGLIEIANKSGAEVKLVRGNIVVSGTEQQRKNAHLLIRSRICLAKETIRPTKDNFALGGEDASLVLNWNESLNRYNITLQEPPTPGMMMSSFEGLDDWMDEQVRKARSDMQSYSTGQVEVYKGSLTAIKKDDRPLQDHTISFRELQLKRDRKEFILDFTNDDEPYHPSSANIYESDPKKLQDFQICILTPGFNQLEWRVFYIEESDDQIRILTAEEAEFGQYYCQAGIGYVYLNSEESFICNVLVPGDHECIRVKFQIDKREAKDPELEFEIELLKQKFFENIELYREGLHKAGSDDLPKGYHIKLLTKKCRTIHTRGSKKEIDTVFETMLVTTTASQGEKKRKVVWKDTELNGLLNGNSWDLGTVKNGIRELFDFTLDAARVVQSAE